MKKAIYPGSFDPVTYGHLDIIKRAAAIFDEVIVAVAINYEKECLFSVEERMRFLKKATANLKNVRVASFKGLAVKYVRKQHARIIVRGLRMISDFEYEFQMALTNRKLAPDIETVFMMPHEAYSYLSSTLIREAVSLGAKVEQFVPAYVAAALKRKIFKK
jgi:pantetheine-phosphate adenylyltransferase